jgi:ferredoxin
MKVRIDYDVCMGDGNCSKVCPEVFGYDSEKLRGVVKLSDVPPQYQAKVRQAADECAPAAIDIEE